MPRIKTSPPRLTALVGRASPKSSATSPNPMRGLVPTGAMKGIDMPNKQRAPHKHETEQKGVISFGLNKGTFG